MSGIRTQESGSSRWESSRKSLFVKTVWIDGHRHFILFDGDPLAECLKVSSKVPSRITSSVSKGSSRSSYKSKNSPTCENFRVPSVKLLLAEIRNISQNPKSVRSETHDEPEPNNLETLSIDVIPNDKVKFRNINEEVVITANANFDHNCNSLNLLKAFKVSRISNSLDIDYHQERINESEHYKNHYETRNLLTPHFHSVDANFTDRYHNSLSDRVLMWLDLATQTGEGIQKTGDIAEKLKVFNCESPFSKNRVVTAHVCSNLRKQSSVNYTKILNRSRSYDCYENNIRTDEWPKAQEVSCLKTTEIPSYSTLKINNLESSSLLTEKVIKASQIPQVSSQLEDSPAILEFPTEMAATKRRSEILKRQLHIFMPNIPKKIDDCDSSLSSKSSSLMKRCSL